MSMHLLGYGRPVDDSVPAVVRAKLADAGWTQVAASAQLGCSPKHLNEIVKGKIAVSVDLAVGLEKLLGDRGLAQWILVAQVYADLRKRGVAISA